MFFFLKNVFWEINFFTFKVSNLNFILKNFQSTGKISQLNIFQANTNIKLASHIEKYFFNNSICCFGCREFCIDQHYRLQVPLNTDWLTRQKRRNNFFFKYFSPSNQFKRIAQSDSCYLYYHRHKRRHEYSTEANSFFLPNKSKTAVWHD